MLRRDYILKIIQELFDSLSKILLTEGDKSEKQKEIEALYSTFGHDKDFFRQASPDEIFRALVDHLRQAQGERQAEPGPDEVAKQAELLATLFYADFKVSNLPDGLRGDVASRALRLYDYYLATSDTYSPEGMDRRDELARFLQNDI